MARLVDIPPSHQASGLSNRPGVLATLIQEHLPALRERAEEAETPLPGFVLRELEAIRDCGDFTLGFLRLQCTGCKRPAVVPFSCKKRLCPTCAGRMMNERAAWLTDRVLFHAPWRQWVVTFPYSLARDLAYQHDLASSVIRVVVRVLFEALRARAGRPSHDLCYTHPSAVVWIQRFSDGGGLYFHLHILVPDGVHVSDPDTLALHVEPAPAPTAAEVQAIVSTVARRVTRLVKRWPV